MAARPKLLLRLLPLWLCAALLLGVGFAVSNAQDGEVPVSQTEESIRLTDPDVDLASTPAVDAEITAAQRARIAREEARGGTLQQRAVSLLGLGVFVLLAWLMSVNRRAVSWRVVAWGIGLQLIFGALILLTAPGREFFESANDLFVALIGYTEDGARFIFGNLVLNNVPVGPAEGPMDVVGGPTAWANTGAFFAFNILPTIIFFSSLMTLLYYFGVMQILVKAFAWVMIRTMGISGAESLSAAGNIFLGQTEAPLLVKPFVRTMTVSELHSVMTGGFATVAGGVLAAYVGMLVAYFPTIAGHLIAASVMSAPAAIAISKVMYPETEEPVTRGQLGVELETTDANAIDAAARGASEGLFLALNVAAMLLAFVALIALLNGLLGLIGDWVNDALRWGFDVYIPALDEISIQLILGYIGAPLAWLMGTPWKDALEVGVLIGEKTAINEFFAYLHLGEMLAGGTDLSARAVVIATYALCGFANFSSIAIQIGGIGGLAPERRGDLSRIGLRAMIAGTLASFMTACVVGILI